MKPHTEEHRHKLSLALKGNQNCLGRHNALGHKRSEETRAKMTTGQKRRWSSPENRARESAAKSGDKNPNWGGGVRITGGYREIKCPDHPYASKNGYVKEHRLVMEAHLGRVLLPTEVVHHINGDRLDNRIENLMLFASNGKHQGYHKTIRALKLREGERE
jgi:hypothetical protein